jgi:hypothetical protein
VRPQQGRRFEPPCLATRGCELGRETRAARRRQRGGAAERGAVAPTALPRYVLPQPALHAARCKRRRRSRPGRGAGRRIGGERERRRHPKQRVDNRRAQQHPGVPASTPPPLRRRHSFDLNAPSNLSHHVSHPARSSQASLSEGSHELFPFSWVFFLGRSHEVTFTRRGMPFVCE